MVLYIIRSLGGSINNGFYLLGRFSYQMGLGAILHWRDRQARHGGEAGSEQEIVKRGTMKIGCDEGGNSISRKGSTASQA